MCVGKKFKHFTRDDRIRLEALDRAGHTPKEIAKQLGFHVSNIYRELNKGAYTHTLSDLTTEERYSSDLGQAKADAVLAAKGANLKIGKHYELANRIEELIADEKYSPVAALAQAKKEGIEFTVCATTLYSYIDKGVFGRITNKDLPAKKEKKNKRYKRVTKRLSKGESIENRPEEANDRKTFGHWEMDTVMGQQGESEKSMLVLTERKTRKEIIFMLKHHTTKEVVKCLDRLERKMGSKKFRAVFKTITVDNGSEFQDWIGMEKSYRNKKKRTNIFYCHPYCSCERGSNENQNKLIRRHIPKGTNFDSMTQADMDRIASWINNYPRELFNFGTAGDMYEAELQKIA